MKKLLTSILILLCIVSSVLGRGYVNGSEIGGGGSLVEVDPVWTASDSIHDASDVNSAETDPAWTSDKATGFATPSILVGAGTVRSAFQISKANDHFLIEETDAPADEKYWLQKGDAGDLIMLTPSDAWDSFPTYVRYSRDGTDITQFWFGAKTSIGGDLIPDSDDAHDLGNDANRWRTGYFHTVVSDAGSLYLGTTKVSAVSGGLVVGTNPVLEVEVDPDWANDKANGFTVGGDVSFGLPPSLVTDYATTFDYDVFASNEWVRYTYSAGQSYWTNGKAYWRVGPGGDGTIGSEGESYFLPTPLATNVYTVSFDLEWQTDGGASDPRFWIAGDSSWDNYLDVDIPAASSYSSNFVIGWTGAIYEIYFDANGNAVAACTGVVDNFSITHLGDPVETTTTITRLVLGSEDSVNSWSEVPFTYTETDPAFTNWLDTNAYVQTERDEIWTNAQYNGFTVGNGTLNPGELRLVGANASLVVTSSSSAWIDLYSSLRHSAITLAGQYVKWTVDGYSDYFLRYDFNNDILRFGAETNIFDHDVTINGDLNAANINENDPVWTNARANGFTLGGDLDMGGNSITNLATSSIKFSDGTVISSSSESVLASAPLVFDFAVNPSIEGTWENFGSHADWNVAGYIYSGTRTDLWQYAHTFVGEDVEVNFDVKYSGSSSGGQTVGLYVDNISTVGVWVLDSAGAYTNITVAITNVTGRLGFSRDNTLNWDYYNIRITNCVFTWAGNKAFGANTNLSEYNDDINAGLWVTDKAAGFTLGGDLDMGGNSISNLAVDSLKFSDGNSISSIVYTDTVAKAGGAVQVESDPVFEVWTNNLIAVSFVTNVVQEKDGSGFVTNVIQQTGTFNVLP